ncbi:zinc knuckle CX2CX4HX4C [Artemisia annua]|uniref:Zinc knuckle CX2CX4HX4C n=1 Tax=Artemisia annua TaxID=35608 RepID=A0A2U1M2Q0_ARTAN|nr:zinc knuckle CX2CX4HX4C [Artemisia annua]
MDSGFDVGNKKGNVDGIKKGNDSGVTMGSSDKVMISVQAAAMKGANDKANVTKEGPFSYASIFKKDTSKKMVKISEMRNNECVTEADVTILLSKVDEVSNRFANTLYGYLIGKRLAFPIAENYVKNTWQNLDLNV